MRIDYKAIRAKYEPEYRQLLKRVKENCHYALFDENGECQAFINDEVDNTPNKDDPDWEEYCINQSIRNCMERMKGE